MQYSVVSGVDLVLLSYFNICSSLYNFFVDRLVLWLNGIYLLSSRNLTQIGICDLEPKPFLYYNSRIGVVAISCCVCHFQLP